MSKIKLSEAQAQLIRPWVDHWLEAYFKMRYGQTWRWYWINWETNQEIML